MVVFTKRLNGLTLIELLIALALCSSLFIIVTIILTTSHKAELTLFSSYQSLDAFRKVTGIFGNDCKATRKSLRLIKSLPIIKPGDDFIISQLKNGVQLNYKTIKFVYLSPSAVYLDEDMASHDRLLVTQSHFKNGDFIMLYDDKDMQLAKIKSVMKQGSKQLVMLDRQVKNKKNKGASVINIHQHVFYFQNDSIYLAENTKHKIVLTSQIQLTNLYYLTNDNGELDIKKVESDIPPKSPVAGFIIKWRIRQSASSLANFWCVMA